MTERLHYSVLGIMIYKLNILNDYYHGTVHGGDKQDGHGQGSKIRSK